MSGDRDKRTISPDPERMEVFIEAMTPPGPVHLQDLELEALAAGVPIIRPQTQNLLRFFLTMKRPSRILEIGTAVGFSALFMQHYAPAECRIITIEKDRVRAQKARENFARYGRISTEDGQTGITLMEGDAIEVLGGIREDASFDLVFMDAAKGQYIRFLPDAVRLLGSGGLLITDNILQEYHPCAHAHLYPCADGGGKAGDPASSDRRRGCGLFKKMRPSEASAYFSSYTCEACVDALTSGMSER